MLAAVGPTPVSAVQLQTFRISGTFGEEEFARPGVYEPALAGGSFNGTLTLDVDNNLSLEDWDVIVQDSSGNTGLQFRPGFPSAGGSYVPGNINLYTSMYYTLSFYVEDDFTGTSTGRAVDVGLSSPVYGEYTEYPSRFFGYAVYVTSFKSEPVPEPFTIGGTAVAGAIGLWLKRKQKASQSL